MLKLKRTYESDNKLLNIDKGNPYTVWEKAKDHLEETKLVSLSSLNLMNVRVQEPHSLRDLYVNSKDSKTLLDTIEKTRETQGDAITVLTIAREIDHSIDNPLNYPTDNSGLFSRSDNEKIAFIPSNIAQCLKDLRSKLSKEGIRLIINIVSNKNDNLNKLYHLDTNSDSITQATILKMSLKNNRKNYSNKDIKSIGELKDFLIQSLEGNPTAQDIVKSYDFKTQSSSVSKAQQARTITGILYFSMAPGADRNHKIGQLDFSYSKGKVNIVPTAARKYLYAFEEGVLVTKD